MTDDLWQQLLSLIEPRRYDINGDSAWETLCADLSALLARHGWPPLAPAMAGRWDWSRSVMCGETLSVMVGLTDLLVLAVDRPAGTIIRKFVWHA